VDRAAVPFSEARLRVRETALSVSYTGKGAPVAQWIEQRSP